MPSAKTTLRFADLELARPGLTVAQGLFYAEAAIVCLQRHKHASGVLMLVKGDSECHLALEWVAKPVSIEPAWADHERAVENGAYAIAILLVEAFTGFTVVAQSAKGTGFDYWLGPKGSSAQLFQGLARLEVSGTNKSGDRNLSERVNRKRAQTAQSDGLGLPAFVIVVEFPAPRSHFSKRDAA